MKTDNNKRVNTTIRYSREQYNERMAALGAKLYTAYIMTDMTDNYQRALQNGLRFLGSEVKQETKVTFNNFVKHSKFACEYATQLIDNVYKTNFIDAFVANRDDFEDIISLFLRKTGKDRKRVEMIKKALERYKDVI